MDLGALLKTFIYLISASLLYPTLLLLSGASLWIIVYAGIFCTEWVERLGLPQCAPEHLPEVIRNAEDPAMLPHRVRRFLTRLQNLRDSEPLDQLPADNLFEQTTLGSVKGLDRLHMMVRIGPSLGLMGTLIPMGSGLAALGQGELSQLSSDLVIAFTTTVVGLAVGITAFFFYTVKRRWVEEDLKNMELAMEVLGARRQERNQ